MGNFDFVGRTLPRLHADCAKAESYLTSDPTAACIYGRRAIDNLVLYLYDLLELKTPYRDDLSARINDAAFTSVTGVGIRQKLNLIRKVGNTAAHGTRPIPPDAALASLRELQHVLIWASFNYSAHPDVVPMQAQFDPALAAQAPPLTKAEVAQLADQLKQQDKEHAAELVARDQRLAAQDAELAALREQIAVAQQMKSRTDDHDYSEAETRDTFIDLLLHEAGWPLDEPRDREYEVGGMPNAEGRGFVDYVLWSSDGRPLAVVEAKRTTKNPHVGQQQAKLYADCLEQEFDRRPVIFYTNGYEHWLWDDASGYPPRQVQGFYTRAELELLVQRRQTRTSLGTAPVSAEIAGRPYQVRAIRAVGDTFESKQRQALLVMATGSGKTRTVIALVDQLMKANWVKRVLFLADRTALVRQAANAFKSQLPSVTTVNLLDEKSPDARVFVSTYPTMMNLIDVVDDRARMFGPGYFDLIVIDEAHRSVYAKYGAIFDWFDGMLVGLTATPKDEVDHNTYRLFHLEDGVPTDAYSLQEAVADGYLVPPRGVSVGTTFLRRGIRYADLSDDEKDEWDSLDWGEDDPPDEVGAEEINRFLFNMDTVDKVIATLMTNGHAVAGGDRLGKTIIFAKNQNHAHFIQERFDAAYPEYAGHFARVITHDLPYAQNLIDDFSVPDKAPHIAISVDMLDTGIDVPDVVNLVFFKLVHSTSKFWQMIGRGTRLRPDLYGLGQDKEDFLVFDFCGNLEYFSQELPPAEEKTVKPLGQRLFEARLALITTLEAAGTDRELRSTTVGLLHKIVAGMNLENVVVRSHRRFVELYSDIDAWGTLTPDRADEVAEHLAALPSSVRDTDEDAKRFDLLILRRQLAQLEGDALTAERVREKVQAIAAALLGATAIPSVAAQAELLEQLAGDEWWVDVTLEMLEHARRHIRGLVRFIERIRREPIYTDFEDELGEATEIALPQTTAGTNWERFRAKAAAYLKQHEDHLALQRLRRGRQLTREDLEALEQMLLASGAGEQADIDRASAQAGGLGLFIRSLVGLDHQAATEAFEGFLDDSRFTLDQIRFVTLVVDELTANGVMEPGRLYESPYTDHAPTGPDYLFEDADVEILVDTLGVFTARARPTDAA